MLTRLSNIMTSVTLLAMCGCVRGPFWSGPEPLPPVPSDGARTVIISPFILAERESSINTFGNIQELLESARVQDISLQMATALKAKGINAEARNGVEPRDLGHGSVLLRGAILPSGNVVGGGRLAAHATLMMFTLGIFGVVLPNPVAHQVPATNYVYRVEVIDRDGRILVQTGSREMVGYYESNYTLSMGDRRKLNADATQRIADAIAVALGGQ